MSTDNLSLSGIRVLDLTQIYNGPYATFLMAMAGAEVIKIEPPEGDPLRHIEPYRDKESKLFEALNRGKQSVVLDMKDAQGISLMKTLCSDADVFIVSLSKNPCPVDLRYDNLKALNGSLIYLDIKAFGDSGTWAECAANDLVLQAYAGNMLSEGKTETDGLTPRPIVSSQMSEYVTAFYGILGISSALFHRARTGEGQRVGASKLQTLLSIQSARIVTNDMADEQNPGFRSALLKLRAEGASMAEIVSQRKRSAPRTINAFYRPYQTRDGAVFLGALTRGLRDKARKALKTTLLGRDDPDYDAGNDEYYNRAMAQQADIEAYVKQKTTREWVSILEQAGVPTGEITFPEDLFDSAQLISNYYIGYVDHPGGSQLHVMPHAQFSAFPRPQPGPAPRFSENTEQVLSSLK